MNCLSTKEKSKVFSSSSPHAYAVRAVAVVLCGRNWIVFHIRLIARNGFDFYTICIRFRIDGSAQNKDACTKSSLFTLTAAQSVKARANVTWNIFHFVVTAWIIHEWTQSHSLPHIRPFEMVKRVHVVSTSAYASSGGILHRQSSVFKRIK